jgi:hypothetical protein
MSKTVKKSYENKVFSREFIPLTDHGVNCEPIGSSELFMHMHAMRIRRWLITETCKNCPDHLQIRRAVDSKQSLLKDMMRARCPDCLEDSLEFFMQDLGPARDDEPCVSLGGKVWL